MTNPTVAELGRNLVAASWAGTGAFALVAGVATAFPGSLARPAAVFDAVLFVVGCVAFIDAYARAVGRSRFDVISVAGVFFLAGEAGPATVRRPLRWALVAQIVIALVTASIRPFTPLAFGVLVPVFGLGLMGMWGARYGNFPRRAPGEAEG